MQFRSKNEFEDSEDHDSRDTKMSRNLRGSKLRPGNKVDMLIDQLSDYYSK